MTCKINHRVHLIQYCTDQNKVKHCKTTPIQPCFCTSTTFHHWKPNLQLSPNFKLNQSKKTKWVLIINKNNHNIQQKTINNKRLNFLKMGIEIERERWDFLEENHESEKLERTPKERRRRG